MKNLVVVESPAKSRTIDRYLKSPGGSETYVVIPTGGHIYESGKVDPDNGFSMDYKLIPNKRKSANSIVAEMKSADRLYLATDPDREGEAISDHVHSYLKERGALNGKEVHRIVFHEITKQAILDSIANPGEISENLVQAQQSRDALDWLVGFNLSPQLWRKLRTPRLSAGRVQSPALRLIVERHREIERFEPKEYWTIGAVLATAESSPPSEQQTPLVVPLVHYEGRTLGKMDLKDSDATQALVSKIEDALQTADGNLTVTNIKRSKKQHKPPPPFKTSTLVQVASRQLHKSAQEIARIAQALYEGININGNHTGLITYTRTDSINLSSTATEQIREFISQRYGKQQLPQSARHYQQKAKNAQEAHEAIRPTNIFLTPESVQSSLTPDQFAVYKLIWNRSVACQMNNAESENLAVDLEVASYRFRATGSKLVSPGWMLVAKPSPSESTDANDEHTLPAFTENQQVPVTKITSTQKFTKPPARYNTSSLIKQLEDYGIGRPSTWPTIISKLIDRDYILVQNQSFFAKSIGCTVVDYLLDRFGQYVEYEFTSKIEAGLDAIAQGEENRVALLSRFWEELKSNIDREEQAQSYEIKLGLDTATGREVLLRVRSAGLYLQLGRRTDEEKPIFRSLPAGQDPGAVTLDYAIEQFRLPSLPRTLDEKTKNGEQVVIKSGRYGPYFTTIDSDGTEKNHNIPSTFDPMQVSITEIEQLLALPQLPRGLGSNAEFTKIEASRGRYGAYLKVTDSETNTFNVSLKPPDDPHTITLERAIEVVKSSNRGQSSRSKKVLKEFDDSKICILDGRYGPYVTDGKTNASIPNGVQPDELDLKLCNELLSKKRSFKSRKKSPKAKFRTKTK